MYMYMYMTSKQYIQSTILSDYDMYMYKDADICTGTDKDVMPRCLSTCVKAYSLLNAMFPPNSFQSSAYRPGQS